MDENKRPLISICCITYNHDKFIRSTLNGFEIQECNFDVEVIIYDDFSQDKTRSILLEYQKESKFEVRLILSKENRYTKGDTIYSKIFEEAKGEYLALCDGDDVWTDAKKLTKQLNFLIFNPKFIGCFHNSNCINEFNTIISNFYFNSRNIVKYSQSHCLKHLKSQYSTSALVFKAYAIKRQIKIFEKIGSDFILDILITEYGDLYYINEIMSSYRVHNRGIWQGSSEKQNLKTNLRRHHFLFNNTTYKKRYNAYLWQFIVSTYSKLIYISSSKRECISYLIKQLFFMNILERRTYGFILKEYFPSLWKLKKYHSD